MNTLPEKSEIGVASAKSENNWFAGTKGQPVNTKPGRLTLYQTAELFDSITCLRIVCLRALDSVNSMHRTERVNKAIPSGDKLSIARALALLKVWHRWTHQIHGEAVPDASAVSGFLWSVENNA
jgi:hypothetical protein